MRPPAFRHSSIARSTAQSECGELSTGTQISRYTGTSLGSTCRAYTLLAPDPVRTAGSASICVEACVYVRRHDGRRPPGNSGFGAACGEYAGPRRRCQARSLSFRTTFRRARPSGCGSRRNELSPLLVVHRDRIHRARVARPQQPLALHGVGVQERGYGLVVQSETLGRFLYAVPEADTLIAVDHDAQAMDQPLLQPAHIPSSPNSLRAVSITAGVISARPCSLAYSA